MSQRPRVPATRTALDTSVLLRLVFGDGSDESARARSLVARAGSRGEALFVSDVVLCDVARVLEAAYRFSRPVVARTLAQLLVARGLAFRDSSALAGAVDRFAKGRGHFTDFVVLAHARAAGCESVATFDRALLKEARFVRP